MSPKYKIFSGRTYMASCKEPADAVRIAAFYETGLVKYAHSEVIYRHGIDGDSNESIDRASMALQENEQAFLRRCWLKNHPGKPGPWETNS